MWNFNKHNFGICKELNEAIIRNVHHEWSVAEPKEDNAVIEAIKHLSKNIPMEKSSR